MQAEAPQVQPVPVVKEAVQTAPVVKQEATAPPNFGGAFAIIDDVRRIRIILFVYIYCRGTRSEKPQKIS